MECVVLYMLKVIIIDDSIKVGVFRTNMGSQFISEVLQLMIQKASRHSKVSQCLLLKETKGNSDSNLAEVN